MRGVTWPEGVRICKPFECFLTLSTMPSMGKRKLSKQNTWCRSFTLSMTSQILKPRIVNLHSQVRNGQSRSITTAVTTKKKLKKSLWYHHHTPWCKQLKPKLTIKSLQSLRPSLLPNKNSSSPRRPPPPPNADNRHPSPHRQCKPGARSGRELWPSIIMHSKLRLKSRAKLRSPPASESYADWRLRICWRKEYQFTLIFKLLLSRILFIFKN